MITALITYVIDAANVDAHEARATVWINPVNRMGGTHDGYSRPSEEADGKTRAIFPFPSLAAGPARRIEMAQHNACQRAFRHGRDTGCIFGFGRIFTRSVPDGDALPETGL